MFTTVVIGHDGSAGGRSAVAFARTLARRQWSRPRLVVIHIDQLVPGRGGAQHAELLEGELQEQVRTDVADLEADGFDAELHVKQVVRNGPASAIAAAAGEVSADLIVVGADGSGSLRGLLHPSTVHRLVQVAPCPVLVTRRDASPLRGRAQVVDLPVSGAGGR